jgi:hypothetical protein
MQNFGGNSNFRLKFEFLRQDTVILIPKCQNTEIPFFRPTTKIEGFAKFFEIRGRKFNFTNRYLTRKQKSLNDDLQGTSLCFSTLTLATISIDRFILIIYPTKQPIHTQQALRMILINFTVATGLSLPMVIKQKLVTYFDFCGQFCTEDWENDDFGRSTYGEKYAWSDFTNTHTWARSNPRGEGDLVPKIPQKPHSIQCLPNFFFATAWRTHFFHPSECISPIPPAHVCPYPYSFWVHPVLLYTNARTHFLKIPISTRNFMPQPGVESDCRS